jgi:hypothetical protein
MASGNSWVRGVVLMGLLGAGACAATLAGQASAEVRWPLRLSSQGNYLEDQAGKPFQIVGDAGWELTTQISDADAITYLDDRLDKGFNAIEIRVIGRSFQDNAPNDFHDNAPFTNGPDDWSARNESYWSRIDAIIAAMKARNLLAIVFPAYLGSNCSSSEGWCEDMLAQSTTTLEAYGAWIGARYAPSAGYGNVLWMTGGDYDAAATSDTQVRNDAVVTGVRSAFPDALFGVEPGPGTIGGVDNYTSVVDINCVYEYNDVAGQVQRAYEAGAPFMLNEATYENEHGSSVILQKSIALITVLGGGLVGQIFGSCPLWNFAASYALQWCDSGSGPYFDSWQHNLDSPGSVAIGNIGKLMRSRKWWTFVPDYTNAVMTNSKGRFSDLTDGVLNFIMHRTGDTGYHATAREAGGETVMVWAPNTNTITIDMTKIAGSQAKAWWWDPSDNSSTLIGTFSTTGTHDFTPSTGQIVLVLDDDAAGLAAPGTAER